MKKKLFRRLFSAALLLFAAFRLYQLIVILVQDPSGATLAADEGAPLPLALALKGALPLHLTSVALLMQRPYISPKWGRVGWWATVITGSWLGVTFLIKLIFLRG